MIVTVGNLKGGAGKTTAAVHLAAEAHRRGMRVLLADADLQRSALTWADIASEKKESAPVVVGVSANLEVTLPEMARDYDLTVVDAPPRGDATTRAAVIVADVTLIPIGPSPVDLWAASATVALIREAASVRKGLRALVLLTRIQARHDLSGQARGATEALGLPVLRTTLGLRAAFAEALAAGQGVGSYAPSSKAAEEMRALFDELVPGRRKGKRQ